MLRVLNCCKRWTKGEHDNRACTVALRKQRFPELIRPRGSMSLTGRTACPLGAFAGSRWENFNEESSPLPVLCTFLKFSVSEASRLKFENLFEGPSSSSNVKEFEFFSSTSFTLLVLLGLVEKLVMLPFSLIAPGTSDEVSLSFFTPLHFWESEGGALTDAFDEFCRLFDSTVTEFRDPNCSWFFSTDFSFFPEDCLDSSDRVSSSVNDPNSSICR